MLFEDNIIFLILKILITYAGTMAMMFSTTSFKFVRKKSINTAMIVLCAVFSVLSTSYVLVFMGWEQLLKGFIFTISIPAVLSLYAVSDEPFARLTFSHATHILFSLYIALTATLINTALHGTMLSDILLRIGFYIPVVLFDFYVLRRIWFNFLRIVRKGWGILVLIPSAFIIMFLLTYSHGQAHGNPAIVTTTASRRVSYTVSGPRDPSGLALWFRRPSPVPFGS